MPLFRFSFSDGSEDVFSGATESDAHRLAGRSGSLDESKPGRTIGRCRCDEPEALPVRRGGKRLCRCGGYMELWP